MDSEQLSVLLDTVVSSETDSDRLSAMSTLHIFLSNLSTKQILCYEKPVPFEALFQCLGTTIESVDDVLGKLCKATCDVLEMFLNTVEPEILLKSYDSELLAGLKHPSGDVKQLCCLQLTRVWNTDKNRVLSSPQFLESLIDCTCDESESSGRAHSVSHKLLVQIGESEVGGEALFSTSSAVLLHLKNCLTRHSSTVWFRLMGVVTQCCSNVSSTLRLCKVNDLLNQFIAKVKDSTDILSQSVAIEMLESLARTEEGYNWLLTQDVMTDMVAMLDDDGNPLAAIVQPAVLKFFGAVTLKYPQKVYDNNDKYFDKLYVIITEARQDDPLLVNALDSLTATASTNHGTLILHRTGPKFYKCLRRVGGLIKEARSEVRQVALCCIEKLMRVCKSTSHQTEVTNICENWYHHMDTDPLGTLLNISNTPFLDSRLAVLHIYMSLVDHMWAQKVMRDHPTFIEYLLNRGTENEREGHYLKYDVICKIVQSSAASQVFPAPTLIKLKLYEREGPLYTQAQSQVATEEG